MQHLHRFELVAVAARWSIQRITLPFRLLSHFLSRCRRFRPNKLPASTRSPVPVRSPNKGQFRCGSRYCFHSMRQATYSIGLVCNLGAHQNLFRAQCSCDYSGIIYINSRQFVTCRMFLFLSSAIYDLYVLSLATGPMAESTWAQGCSSTMIE
jgi:hypothetical protein